MHLNNQSTCTTSIHSVWIFFCPCELLKQSLFAVLTHLTSNHFRYPSLLKTSFDKIMAPIHPEPPGEWSCEVLNTLEHSHVNLYSNYTFYMAKISFFLYCFTRFNSIFYWSVIQQIEFAFMIEIFQVIMW